MELCQGGIVYTEKSQWRDMDMDMDTDLAGVLMLPSQNAAQAKRKMNALRKKGVDIQPVEIEGRKIAKSFWGQAWCDHLESFSDYANRLPRGRTYVRNGSVCHLEIREGEVQAIVAGSEIYELQIAIETLPAKKWDSIKKQCAGQIGSLLELLQGKLSDQVMMVVSDPFDGLFPFPDEISMQCSCPDWADMCKHLAAVLYGVGARLDRQPELLFKLRGVDYEELIAADAEAAVSAATSGGSTRRLAADDLSDVFGIDLDMSGAKAENAAPKKSPRRTASKTRKKKATKKKATEKKATREESKGKEGRREDAGNNRRGNLFTACQTGQEAYEKEEGGQERHAPREKPGPSDSAVSQSAI